MAVQPSPLILQTWLLPGGLHCLFFSIQHSSVVEESYIFAAGLADRLKQKYLSRNKQNFLLSTPPSPGTSGPFQNLPFHWNSQGGAGAGGALGFTVVSSTPPIPAVSSCLAPAFSVRRLTKPQLQESLITVTASTAGYNNVTRDSQRDWLLLMLSKSSLLWLPLSIPATRCQAIWCHTPSYRVLDEISTFRFYLQDSLPRA